MDILFGIFINDVKLVMKRFILQIFLVNWVVSLTTTRTEMMRVLSGRAVIGERRWIVESGTAEGVGGATPRQERG